MQQNAAVIIETSRRHYEMSDKPYLTEQEIVEMTKYKMPRKQMEVLRQLGITATLLRDNTVRVMRASCYNLTQQSNRPKLKV